MSAWQSGGQSISLSPLAHVTHLLVTSTHQALGPRGSTSDSEMSPSRKLPSQTGQTPRERRKIKTACYLYRHLMKHTSRKTTWQIIHYMVSVLSLGRGRKNMVQGRHQPHVSSEMLRAIRVRAFKHTHMHAHTPTTHLYEYASTQTHMHLHRWKRTSFLIIWLPL